mgnify:FL=1
MANYHYSAINDAGEIKKSSIYASSKEEVSKKLAERGMMPISIEEAEFGDNPDSGTRWMMKPKVKRRVMILFYKMLSSMIGSGITIAEALNVILQQEENRRFKKVLHQVIKKVEGGISLSDAMAEHPNAFNEMSVNMIRVGELGGMLEQSLITIAEFLENRAKMQAKIIMSFIYPAIVMLIGIGVVIFLVVFVIPKFSILLKGKPLPWNTQFLLDVTDYIEHNYAFIFIVIAMIIVSFISCFVIRDIKINFDRIKVKIPVVGPVMLHGLIVQFSRTLAALFSSGIPFIEALEATKQTFGNLAIKKYTEEILEKVRAGDSFSSALEGKPIFSPLLCTMVTIGEHSGNLDGSLNLVADVHEEILEVRVQKMTSLIEPVLIITLGVLVGFVAWGLIAGMLSLYG